MFKILRKELKTFFKDRRAVMLGFLMPIILITVFSMAFGGLGGTVDNSKVKLLISDEDKTATSQKVISGLDSVSTIQIRKTTTDSALSMVKAGKYAAVLIFHKGFDDSVQTIKHLPWEMRYDAAQSIEMSMMQGIVEQSLFGKVGKMMSEKMIVRNAQKQFAGMDSMTRMIAMYQMKKNLESSSKDMDKLQNDIMKLDSSPMERIKDNTGIIQAVAGTAVMMLLFSLTAMGGRLIEEKENGTLKRLLYSPLTATDILGGKMLSAMLFSTSQLIIMFTYSSLAFGLIVSPKIAQVAILIVATAFACSAFGTFLSSFIKSRDQLQSLSTLIILIMSAIGGSMVPSFLMPEWMQNVGHISINYWSIQGFYDIFWRQLPVTSLVFLEKVAVLMVIGIVLSALSFASFRKNAGSMA